MVDTAAAQAGEDVDEDEEQEVEREYWRSVENDDPPIYGNLSMDHNNDNVFWFLSININGLLFWLQRNHKAELLKLLLKRYNVECLGLQEICINWSKFKVS